MWNDDMNDIEEAVCKKYNVKYGVFTGNGTTAMYLAFQALGMQKKKGLFPGISCTNPVNAALFADYQVDFCDVSICDYTICADKMEQMLQTGEYGIVVPTHIYGHRYQENKIHELCDKYHVVLFEDAAQSFYTGKMDVAVVSFGHTKVCETQLGGGMALTNDKQLYEKMCKEKLKLTKLDSLGMDLFDQYRERYYDILKKNADWEERNKKLKELQLDSKKYFIFDLDDNKKIIEELDKLEETVTQRRKKVVLYQEKLNHKYVIKPLVKDLFRWRYTFLYEGDRDYLLRRARKEGIDISSWYLSLAGIYKGEHLTNSDTIEKKVVNLWLDKQHSTQQIMSEIDCLNRIMEEDYERNK